VYAPEVGEAVPQLKAPMESFVIMVDQLRAWLDAQVAMLMGMINGAPAEPPAADGS
jgi:hypothetical protein